VEAVQDSLFECWEGLFAVLGKKEEKGNRLSALMSSSAYDHALQHAQEHNATGVRSKGESHFRDLCSIVLEIDVNGSVLMHPGCKSIFFLFGCVFRFSSLVSGNSEEEKAAFSTAIRH
jgi:hypothetical protein